MQAISAQNISSKHAYIKSSTTLFPLSSCKICITCIYDITQVVPETSGGTCILWLKYTNMPQKVVFETLFFLLPFPDILVHLSLSSLNCLAIFQYPIKNTLTMHWVAALHQTGI